MTTDTRTSVMLVDDHSIMRDLARDALENTGEFQVVAQQPTGRRRSVWWRKPLLTSS